MKLIHHNNNNRFRMFKPSLKRSKLQQIQLYSHRKEPPHHHHTKLLSGQPSSLRYQSLPSCMIPASLLTPSQPKPNPAVRLFNPLNYQWKSYPEHIQDKLQMREEQQTRGIGYYKDYIWYFHANEIILEHTLTQKHKVLLLQQRIDCLALGEIANSSFHLKSRQLFIVAIGVENMLHLYGIEKDSLNLTDFNFSCEILNSRLIQKIKFVNSNEIIIATDTCNYCHIDFAQEMRIRQVKRPFLRQILPFMPLIYPAVNYFVEDLQMDGNTIYSLVREQRKTGWLSVKATKLINKFTRQNKEPQYITETRKIQILEINKKDNSIIRTHQLTEDELIKKLMLSSPEFEHHSKREEFRIVSIWLSRQQDQEVLLSVVTRGGYFITIKKGEDLHFAKTPVLIPKPSSIGLVGFNVQKKEEANEEMGRSNRVKASLGLGNLTLMNDSVWYLDEGVMQVVKGEQIIGEIVEVVGSVLDAKRWMILTKQGYYIVKRLEHREIFLSYLYVKNRMVNRQPQKSWHDQTNFNLFLDGFSKIVGNQKICEFLLQILIFEKLQFEVTDALLARIKEELKGGASRDYRDWSYQLDVNEKTKVVEVDEQFRSECWKYLLQFQFKSAKVETQTPPANGVSCSAYWYGLIHLFHRIVKDVLSIKPSYLKQNLPKIQTIIRLLERLSLAFVQKREREHRQAQNYQLCKKQIFTSRGVSRFASKRLKKEEEQSESTIDHSNIVANNRIINESNTKLQNIIDFSIGKIKAMTVVFMFLADLSENENLPSLEQTLKFRKNQQMVKKYLIARVEDRQKLEEFAESLPELELGKDLKCLHWLDYTSKIKRFDEINLAEVATFISSQYLPKTLQLLEGKFDLQTDLLLLYWDYLSSQLQSISSMQLIETKREDIFAEEKKKAFEQKREFICEEIKFIETQARLSITNGLKAYMSSNQKNYTKIENMVNAIVEIVAAHDDASLNTYLEAQLTQFGISQKLILFKSLKRKTVKVAPAWQSLLFRELPQTQPKKRRQLLSTFEAYLLQSK